MNANLNLAHYPKLADFYPMTRTEVILAKELSERPLPENIENTSQYETFAVVSLPYFDIHFALMAMIILFILTVSF